jgi:hypothetical protein
MNRTDPPIWRRLLVPADLTLEQLHDVLQLAMGWEDCHMHEFRIGQQRFGKPDPMEQASGGPRTASERTARLVTALGRVGAKAVYTYDFGDRWEHQIVRNACSEALDTDPILCHRDAVRKWLRKGGLTQQGCQLNQRRQRRNCRVRAVERGQRSEPAWLRAHPALHYFEPEKPPRTQIPRNVWDTGTAETGDSVNYNSQRNLAQLRRF